MLAARLYPGSSLLRLEEVPRPEPTGDQVLVRVAGAGVCRSDLHALDGACDMGSFRLPVTMGHEIAGWVETMGPDVDDLATGDAVAVMVGWGCGSCRSCVTGHEQICPRGDEAGSTMDGGFAEYVLVPHRRHLVPLGTLSPVEAAPLGDAALSAYAATRRVMPHLVGGSTIVVIGIGGLGQYGVQFARALTAAIVVAVDTRHERLPLAIELGADHAVLAGESSTQEITDLVGPDGADAVVDFVGSDASLQLAAGIVGRRGVVALLGLGGGHCSFGFEALAPEASLTTVYAGSVGDLHDVVALARLGRLTTRVSTHPLRDINQVLDDLRAGRVAGRAVLVP